MRKCNSCKIIQDTGKSCERCSQWRKKAKSVCCSCSKIFNQRRSHYANHGNYCLPCIDRLDEIILLRKKPALSPKQQIRFSDLTYKNYTDFDVHELLTSASLWKRPVCYNKAMTKEQFIEEAATIKLGKDELGVVIDSLTSNSDFTIVGQVFTNHFTIVEKQPNGTSENNEPAPVADAKSA